jgi:dipeptidyl aminopeptidase/acylaminoacyl peptidase
MLLRLIRVVASIFVLYIVSSVVAGIYLAEASVHLRRKAVTERSHYVEMTETYSRFGVEDAAIHAADGTVLKGWYVRPDDWNHESVVLLHGVADNREGVAGYSVMFLKAGYAVLLPDSRAHGESGGAIATYGVLERSDVSRWAESLRNRANGCVYLFGESMGAAIALQAMTVTHGLCAVVVESPFSTFREIAYDRIAQTTGTGSAFSRTVARPMLEAALLYVRLRYNVTLADAQPAAAVAASPVPALLIAGMADHNITARHAVAIMRTAPAEDALWEVARADHGGAVRAAGPMFDSRVLGWFRSHQNPAS